MPKRFTETTLWDEDWFIALPKDYQLFWIHLKDACDHAGIWKPNVFKFNKLYNCNIDINDALTLINTEKKRLWVLSNGRWFIMGFIHFQYGDTMNENNRVHKSIMDLLRANNVLNEIQDLNLTSNRPQLEDTQGVKDKDKDKDKDAIQPKNNHISKFDIIWDKYPRKLGRREAERHFNSSIKTEQDFKDIGNAIENFLASKVCKGDPQYIPHGSTWFNNWRDWVNYVEPITEQMKAQENSEILRKAGIYDPRVDRKKYI